MFFDRDLFSSASDGCDMLACGCIFWLVILAAAGWGLWRLFT